MTSLLRRGSRDSVAPGAAANPVGKGRRSKGASLPSPNWIGADEDVQADASVSRTEIFLGGITPTGGAGGAIRPGPSAQLGRGEVLPGRSTPSHRVTSLPTPATLAPGIPSAADTVALARARAAASAGVSQTVLPPVATTAPTAARPGVVLPGAGALIEGPVGPPVRVDLVEVGCQIWNWGRKWTWVGLGALLVVVYASLLIKVPGADPKASGTVPVLPMAWLGDAYLIAIHGIAVLLGMAAQSDAATRGAVTSIVGFAPFVGLAVLGIPAGTAAVTITTPVGSAFLFATFPAWVLLLAGLLAARWYPQLGIARGLAAVGAVVVAIQLVVGSGSILEIAAGNRPAYEGGFAALGALIVLATLWIARNPNTQLVGATIRMLQLYLVGSVAASIVYGAISRDPAGAAATAAALHDSAFLGLFALASLGIAATGVADLVMTRAFRNDAVRALGAPGLLDPHNKVFRAAFLGAAKRTHALEADDLTRLGKAWGVRPSETQRLDLTALGRLQASAGPSPMATGSTASLPITRYTSRPRT